MSSSEGAVVEGVGEGGGLRRLVGAWVSACSVAAKGEEGREAATWTGASSRSIMRR